MTGFVFYHTKRFPKRQVGLHRSVLLLACTILYTKFFKVYTKPQSMHVSKLSLPPTMVSSTLILSMGKGEDD